MPVEPVERRLAAILSADVVGYSRLMAEDEAATIRTLTEYREQLARLVRQHRGRVVDQTGDNALAEFPSALDAVSAAIEIQQVLSGRNADLSPKHRMRLRIGVHLGDVVVDGERIYGDGINIAARLEGLADAGGICISDMIYKQVRSKLDCGYEDLGEREVKNIPGQVRVYRISVKTDESAVSQAPPGSDEPTAAGSGAQPAIAVLPFDNMSGDPDQEYFADGLAEDLITRLSSFRLFSVIARNSSFVYKGRAVDVKRVGRELAARYVIEGSVRKIGDRVRISVQLIDTATSHHVWAHTYDRELRDIFAVQDEIVRAVAGSIFPEVIQSERRRAAHKEPQNLDAWECGMRGWWHVFRPTRDDNTKARSLFEKALELDPRLSTAFSGLSRTHHNDILFQWTDSPARSTSEAVRAAEACIGINDRDHSGYLALGLAYSLTEGKKAISAFRLALELNPNSSAAHFYIGLSHALGCRPDASIAALETAMQLSPQDPQMWSYLWSMALAHFSAERFEETVDWARRSIQRKADWPLTFTTLAAGHAHLGQVDKARAAVQELLQLSPGFSLSSAMPFLSTADPAFVDRYLDGLRKAGLPE